MDCIRLLLHFFKHASSGVGNRRKREETLKSIKRKYCAVYQPLKHEKMKDLKADSHHFLSPRIPILLSSISRVI